VGYKEATGAFTTPSMNHRKIEVQNDQIWGKTRSKRKPDATILSYEVFSHPGEPVLRSKRIETAPVERGD